MRWALRRQQNIKAHFEPRGEETLNRIRQSLNQAFANDGDPGAAATRQQGEPYPVILISDTQCSGGTIAFYIIRKMYDVYTLAFKGFQTQNIK